ncbi:MAG: non-hydrolyzing UDP-N-acetylglucosamine 2-epimerase [Planctomycetota bacterium]|jgi:UDP-N-acetylglucosamine 2-epimerase
MKLINVVGARPQFIKAAAVSRAIAEHNKKNLAPAIEEKIVHTGQHYDEKMSKVFFEELNIPRPDYDLEVGSGRHGMQTGLMLERIESVLVKEKPDVCIVYGDTNTTLAGSLAAVKLHIPVAHVEAGLRSFNRIMPEEINRILTDHVSNYLFCPTETSVKNLTAEGIYKGVYQVGDVMYDCILFYVGRAKSIEEMTLKKLQIKQKSFYLATVHRAENTDDKQRLSGIVEGLNEIATDGCPVILPLHPRTVKRVEEFRLRFNNNIKVIEPVSYLEMVALENNSKAILTDSGGVQKESYWLKVPCITLRDETEWVETVECGWNFLAGIDHKAIIEKVQNLQNCSFDKCELLYGEGNTAEKICEELCR